MVYSFRLGFALSAKLRQLKDLGDDSKFGEGEEQSGWLKSQFLMGRIYLVELEGRTYKCRFCDSPLALADDVLSRSFNCRQGRAYLFSNVVNITFGPEEERLMLSGLHTVEDIFCVCCGQILGWRYVIAHDKNQKYKEGKFVLERWRIEEDVAEEFNMDSRPGSSDADIP